MSAREDELRTRVSGCRFPTTARSTSSRMRWPCSETCERAYSRRLDSVEECGQVLDVGEPQVRGTRHEVREVGRQGVVRELGVGDDVPPALAPDPVGEHDPQLLLQLGCEVPALAGLGGPGLETPRQGGGAVVRTTARAPRSTAG